MFWAFLILLQHDQQIVIYIYIYIYIFFLVFFFLRCLLSKPLVFCTSLSAKLHCLFFFLIFFGTLMSTTGSFPLQQLPYIVPTVITYLTTAEALRFVWTNKQIKSDACQRARGTNSIVCGFGALRSVLNDVKGQYMGLIQNAKSNGLGLWRFPEEGYLYSGLFLNGHQHGIGHEHCNNQSYEGEFKHGKRDGTGVFCFCRLPNAPHKDLINNVLNAKYRGDWKNNRMHGKGVLSAHVKLGNQLFVYEYDGHWIENKRTGQGSISIRSSITIRQDICLSRSDLLNMGEICFVSGEWENNHIKRINSTFRNNVVSPSLEITLDILAQIETAIILVRPLLRTPFHVHCLLQSMYD